MQIDTPPPGISRRRITSAAAWSIPAITVVIATPAAAASTDAWNIALSATCVADGVTGYTIQETQAATPPASLLFNEYVSIVVEYPGASDDADGAKYNHAQSVTNQLITVLQDADVPYQDSNVALDPFGLGGFTVGTKPGSPDTGRIEYGSPSRRVIVSSLPAGGAARYGYQLDATGVDTSGLSVTFAYYLLGIPADAGEGESPASPGSQGSSTSDDIATLSGVDTQFTLSC